jgi:hypothetical protein
VTAGTGPLCRLPAAGRPGERIAATVEWANHPLDQIAQAQEAVEGGAVGKVLVTPG